MPNWIEGTFRARGGKENIKRFLMEGLTPVGFFGEYENISKEIYCDDGDCLTVIFKHTNNDNEIKDAKTLHIKDTRRQFIEDLCCGEISAFRKKSNDEFQFATNFKGAWSLDEDAFVKIAKEFKIDIRVNGFERGMEFEQLLEVGRNGVIRCQSVIQYDDYEWQCPMSLLGG